MKKILNQLCPPIFKILITRAIATTKYKIGNIVIITPKNYPAPKNQKIFYLYDKFLPILASTLSKNQTGGGN